MAAISSREITEKYNISYQTLNFYTTLGLFDIRRRIGNKRYYDDEEVRVRLVRITALKEEGFPLRMIVRQITKDGNSMIQPEGLR